MSGWTPTGAHGSRKRYLAEQAETEIRLFGEATRVAKRDGLSPGMNRQQTISSLKERSDNAKLETVHGAIGLGGVGLLGARYAPGVKPAARKILEHASLATAVVGGGIGGAYALRRAATDRHNIAAQRAQLGVSKGSGTVERGVPVQSKVGPDWRKHGLDLNPHRAKSRLLEIKHKANMGEHAKLAADVARDDRDRYLSSPSGRKWARKGQLGQRGDVTWGPEDGKTNAAWRKRVGFGLERKPKPKTGFRGSGAPYGVVTKGRIPFLHPSAKPFSYARAAQRFAGRATMPRNMVDAVRQYRRAPVGPKAPHKVMSALSGQDFGETVSRLGRATRRSQKEYSSAVHPISGRILDMRRGDAHSAGLGGLTVAAQRQSSVRMARLADRAKNPEVRARAQNNLQGLNHRIQGPKPVLLHNHPSNEHMHRSTPSGADMLALHQLGGHRMGVISHAPGPRGSKQTRLTMTRNMEPDSYMPQRRADTVNRIIGQDRATQSSALTRMAANGDEKVHRQLVTLKAKARRGARRSGPGKIQDYDAYVHQSTGSRKKAQSGGIYTTTTLHKAYAPLKTSISEDDARREIERHGLKGPLPKGLTREQKMSAYEARYVTAGGHKAEQWNHRAHVADKVKGVGLAGATGAGALLLAGRTRTGASAGKFLAEHLSRVPNLQRHAETAAIAAGTAGGAGELYAGHARRKRSSYASAPAGVAASALRRMQGYTPT